MRVKKKNRLFFFKFFLKDSSLILAVKIRKKEKLTTKTVKEHRLCASTGKKGESSH
jgi:hypothetical protein